MPEVYDQFVEICNKLENHYKDMQDMGSRSGTNTSHLQTHFVAKRTPAATLKIACDGREA